MAPVIEGGDIIESLGDRILGRIVAQDVLKPRIQTKLLYLLAP